MIIFGTRNVGSTVKTGTFFCPVCQQQTNYKHITNRNFAHLFFIPLFPIGGSEEYIECQRCGTPFGVEVLSEQPRPEQGPSLGDYNALALAGMELVAAVDASISPQEVQTVTQLYRQVSAQDVDGAWVQRVQPVVALARSRFTAQPRCWPRGLPRTEGDAGPWCRS